jgi:PAS domain S-box-containing protein
MVTGKLMKRTSRTARTLRERRDGEVESTQAKVNRQKRELREISRELETARDEYAQLFDAAPIGYLILCRRGVIRRMNPAAARLLGADLDQPRGFVFTDFIEPADARTFTRQLKKCADTGEPQMLHLCLPERNGIRFCVQIHTSAAHPASRDRDYFLTTLTDITAVKEAEEALRVREGLLETMTNLVPIGLLRFDANGGCTYANPRWSKMTGIRAKAALGTGWVRSIHNEDRKRVTDGWIAAVRKRAAFKVEYRIGAAKQERWVLDTGVPEAGTDGKAVGFIRAITDISDQKNAADKISQLNATLEERVRRRTNALVSEMSTRQSLEQVVLEIKDGEQKRLSDQLHEGLGQHLTGLSFLITALHHDLEERGAPEAAAMEKIAELVDRAMTQSAEVVRGLTPVANTAGGLDVALQQLVADANARNSIHWTYKSDAKVNVSDNAVATHLYRIAQEAVENARRYSGARQASIHLFRSAKSIANLIVRDDGDGITSAPPQNGGRGMNIMHYRAKLIGATLSVRPARRRGTEVRVRFSIPAADGS